MKKLLITFVTFILLNSAVYAETMIVQAMSDISTLNPPKTSTVMVLSNTKLDDNIQLKSGDIIVGYIIDVQDPKRLKRDAKFSFEIYGMLKGKNISKFEKTYIGKYTTKLNKAEVAKTAALGVGNFFVKGFSMGYKAVEGAVKNEEGNVLESSATAVYQSSPISYVEKGEDLNIKKGDVFYLKIKTSDNDDEDNYEKKNEDK